MIGGGNLIIEVKLIPVTWIRAPLVTEQQLKRYIAKGWIKYEKPEAVDRAFPRTNEGRPFIPKIWLEAPLIRASKILGINTKVARSWEIVKKIGDKYIPVNYIEIKEDPLIYSRTILTSEKQTMEVFEYIDGTYELKFFVSIEDRYIQDFFKLLAVAGEIGMMSQTKRGYGKFKCEVRVEEEVKIEEARKKSHEEKLK